MMSVKLRLVMALASAGVPVDTVTITGDSSADVSYMPWATQEQRDLGAAVLAVFDWSSEAQEAWERQQTAGSAKQIIASSQTDLVRAIRTPCTAITLSLKEAREKINEIIIVVNTATGSSIATLESGSTPEQDLAVMFWLLDNGIT